MSLKYVAAYLMSVAAGHNSPSGDDVKEILSTIGAEIDEEILGKLISEMSGKTAHEVIAAGMSKLQSVPSGGAVAASAGAGAGAAKTAAAAVEVEEEEAAPEEEEEDMGFSLFD